MGDSDWYSVREFILHKGLDEFTLTVQWGGNNSAALRAVLLRDGREVISVEP